MLGDETITETWPRGKMIIFIDCSNVEVTGEHIAPWRKTARSCLVLSCRRITFNFGDTIVIGIKFATFCVVHEVNRASKLGMDILSMEERLHVVMGLRRCWLKGWGFPRAGVGFVMWLTAY